MTRSTTGICLILAATIGVTAIASDGDRKSTSNQRISVEKKSPKKETKRSEARPSKNDEKKDQSSNRWMQMKLTSSQVIFAELTRGNLKGVAKNARAEQVLEVLEFWLRGREFRQRSEYHAQLNRYQFAVKELARHAEAGDIDGALDSWVAVSRSCVECHKLLRDGAPSKQLDKESKPENESEDARK